MVKVMRMISERKMRSGPCQGKLDCGCSCQGSMMHLPGPHFLYKTGHTCERTWEMLMEKHKWLMEIQPEGNPYAFPMWGFECGLGWYFIIDEALTMYKAIYEATGSYPIIDQIKEKFGTMRFYASFTIPTKTPNTTWQDIGFIIADYAESKSGRTCMSCGAEGTTNTDGWIMTLCKGHWAKNKEAHERMASNDKD